MTSIMEQHREEKGELPLVYVLVIYNGAQKYRYSTDLFDLFRNYHTLARETFLQLFHLIDLSQISDEDLKHKAWSGILQMCLKNRFKRDLIPLIDDMGRLLQEVEKAGAVTIL